MVGKIFSCTFTGLDCNLIEVQSDVSGGLPSFTIVGLGDTSVQESKERVRSSIKNSQLKFPQSKKTINLSPAQLKKHGSHFDLPIAISLLIADRQLPTDIFKNALLIGELSLNGNVRGTKGVLAITQYAKEQGFKSIFLPKENALEASFIEGINIYPIENLKQIFNYAAYGEYLETYPHSDIDRFRGGISNYTCLDNIIGHQMAKRALKIAAAGNHNTLLYGSPGCGKTLLCRSIRSLLPYMSKDQIIQTTKVYSVAGMLRNDTPLIQEKPFREVHHTSSPISIIGGGTSLMPGEISLAHNGVLFFDEISEFKKTTLEALRQPLEDKNINISRVNYNVNFPANFLLLATMNPCPCGYKSDPSIDCICADYQIKNYQKRISGPLLDRFDIYLEILKVPMKKVLDDIPASNNKDLLEVISAQRFQDNRYKDLKISQNSELKSEQLKKYCPLTKNAKNTLERASDHLSLSNRGYIKLVKLARTIADLEQKEVISANHISEAIQYRPKR